MDLIYKIEFHSYWHCGSGLAAGAGADALTLKDKHQMPFIPGKTVKGLFREALDEFWGFQKPGEPYGTPYYDLFGSIDGSEKQENCDVAKSFFSDAVIAPVEYNAIVSNKVQKFLFQNIASTAIDENGLAMNATLRKIEVCIPCCLEGVIYNVPEEMEDTLSKSVKMLRAIGLGRNHGLGRCTVSLVIKERRNA